MHIRLQQVEGRITPMFPRKAVAQNPSEADCILNAWSREIGPRDGSYLKADAFLIGDDGRTIAKRQVYIGLSEASHQVVEAFCAKVMTA